MSQPHPGSSSLSSVAMKTWISFLVITGGVLLLLFLFAIRSVVLQLVIGLLFAIALAPVVGMMTRRGMSRIFASIIAVIGTSIALLVVVGAIASPLITQGDDLARNAPKFVERTTANPTVRSLDEKYHVVTRAKQAAKEAPEKLTGAGSPILGTLGSILGVISTTGVVLIVGLFMLIEGPTAWKQFLGLLKPEQAGIVDGIAHKVTLAVSGFVSGNLLISLIAGTVALVTLLVLGVPYAFALAALVAVFDVIPLVGAAIATAILALVALTKGVVVAAIVVAVMLVYQFVEGNIIQPIVYARAVQMSQLLTLVASIIGATLGGIIGVLLAIPVAAVVQIVIVELLKISGASMQPAVAGSVPAKVKS